MGVCQQILKRILLVVIVGLFILGSISSVDVVAQTVETDDILLDEMQTTAIIHANGTTSIIIDTRVTNVGSAPISSANIRVDSLTLSVTSASSGSVTTEFTITNMDRHSMINIQLRNSLGINESEWIHLELQSYDTQTNPELDANTSFVHGSLVYYVRPHVPVSNFTFVALLPAHASLSHSSSVPLFPDAETNFTDGERIAFKWFVSTLQPGQERAFIIQYQVIINENDIVETSFTVLAFVGLVGVIVGVGGSTFGPMLVNRFKRFGEVQYAGITSEEKIILETLQLKGGSCSQKDLYNELDISESKLSLILSGLEERGLVKRFREGRANIVHRIEE